MSVCYLSARWPAPYVLEQIARLDPAAYGDVGDHRTHFWPAVLDRWLY
jgi:hypothetical protein